MTHRAGPAVAGPACLPFHPTASNLRTPCRSTTTSAKGAGRSRQCGPWRSSATRAPARHAGLTRHENCSARQPSPASTRPATSPTQQPRRARRTCGTLRRRIQPAVAVAPGDCRCRGRCPPAAGSSRRTGRSRVAGCNPGEVDLGERHRGCATGRIHRGAAALRRTSRPLGRCTAWAGSPSRSAPPPSWPTAACTERSRGRSAAPTNGTVRSWTTGPARASVGACSPTPTSRTSGRSASAPPWPRATAAFECHHLQSRPSDSAQIENFSATAADFSTVPTTTSRKLWLMSAMDRARTSALTQSGRRRRGRTRGNRHMPGERWWVVLVTFERGEAAQDTRPVKG